jgi:short-subunit dehydrogenase
MCPPDIRNERSFRGETSMKSQTVLITGATSGIGRDATFALLHAGHRVVATGRNRAALAALELAAPADKLLAIELDVTDPASIERAVLEVDRWTAGRGVDALVNNAGYGVAAPLVESPDAELRGQFETNVFGLMAMVRAFTPKMMDRGRGTVVNVSSIGGRMTFPMLGGYNATKYAVESLSDALRRELAAFGVRVVLVEPGAIKTAFADRTVRDAGAYLQPSSRYRVAFARAEELRAKFDATSASPAVVSKAIRTAIESRRPAARYVVPFSARFMVALVNWLPTRFVDWALERVAGLTPRGLGLERAEPPQGPALPVAG